MNTEQKHNIKQRLTFFELLIEVFGWLQIVASPLLVGLVLGFLFYVSTPDRTGVVIGVIIAFVGLVIGIIWATRVWKKKGTIHFMSRIMATPELDKHDEKQGDSTQSSNAGEFHPYVLTEPYLTISRHTALQSWFYLL